MIWSWSSIFTLALSLLLISCDLLDEERELLGSNNTNDVAVTSDVSEKGVTFAEIYGFVNLDYFITTPKFGVELSEFEDFDSIFSIKVFTKELEGNRFTVRADYLNGNTVYYYRTFVQSNGVYIFGDINSFKTDAFNNITKNGDVSELAYTSVVINGTADTVGLDMENAYAIGFIYSDDKSRMNPDSLFLTNDDGKYRLNEYGNRILGFNCAWIPFDSINNKKQYKVSITRLKPNKTYYYCSFTAAGNKLILGTIKSFKTKAFTEQQFSTSVPQNVSITCASLAGKANLSSIYKNDKQIRYYFRCSTSVDSLDIWPYQEYNATVYNNTYTAVANNLKEGTTYYYSLLARIYDENGRFLETIYAEPKSFTTKLAKNYLTVDNVAANNITIISASITGKSTLSSIYKNNERINYYIAYAPTLFELKNGYYSQVRVTQNNNILSGTAVNLNGETKYYYSLIAQTANETIMSEPKSFITKAGKDYLTVNNATNIDISSAIIAGSSRLGTFNIDVSSYRIAYSTSFDNLRDGYFSSVPAAYNTSNNTFSATLNYLAMGTTYYYTVVASTNHGTLYGEIKSFTTNAVTLQKTGFVDLGLSVKWAACNLGASVPEDFGSYYAWAETQPKTYYSSSNYTLVNKDNISASQYDAARAKLGVPYRMPTRQEFQELIDNCIWSPCVYNNTPGYYVVRNNKAIFMPQAGYKNGSELNAGFYYWTSTQYTYNDFYLEYNIETTEAYYATFGNTGNALSKFYGLPIRPVYK